jgi:hypothetical protein
MPSPDPDGDGPIPGGADNRTVTITSGKELVWQQGATDGMLKTGQEEVIVGNQTLMFANFIKGSIHVFGFQDVDVNGTYNSNIDKPWDNSTLPSKKIDLFDNSTGLQIDSQYTNENGEAWFLGLVPGNYTLREDLSIFDPDQIMASPDPDGDGPIPGGADNRTVTITSGIELAWEEGATDGMLKDGQEEEVVDNFILHFANFIKPSYIQIIKNVTDTAILSHYT